MEKNINKSTLIGIAVGFVVILIVIYFYKDALVLSEPKFSRTYCSYKNFNRTNCEKEDYGYFYTFKVDIDRQKVLQVVESPKLKKEKGMEMVSTVTQELENCKVFDKLNWQCDIWHMSNGNMMPAIEKGLSPTVIGGHIYEGSPDRIYDFEKK